jgi:hypothetical protein
MGLPSFVNKTRRGFVVLAIALIVVLHVTNHAVAQSPPDGYNAICLTTACTNTGIGSTIASSSAYIDASVFYTAGGDFCQAVNEALNELASTTVGASYGGIVDARGINPGTAHTNTCANNLFTSPNTITTPSTILLPSGTITISATWILPDRTRIVGEGNNPDNGTQVYVSSDFSGTAMIQMGSSSLCPSSQCYGISVEYVYFFGLDNVINGIVNEYGGSGSYVDHCNFYHILGTGLVIGQYATDSGPYSNMAMTAGPACIGVGQSNPSTACVHIGDSSVGSPQSTRGVHSLTCTCEGSGPAGGTGQTAIAVNSSNNTLEDMHFEGYIDGIELGYQGNARNNVILSVNGGGNATDSMTNVIHICSSTSMNCANSNTVSDVTIETAVSTNANGGTVTNVITDDLTGTVIHSPSSPVVTSVGLYALGDAMGSSGYSRFTTGSTSSSSTNVSTWAASSTTPSGTCQSGSLFSNINGVSSGTSGNWTLWVCSGGAWTHLLH